MKRFILAAFLWILLSLTLTSTLVKLTDNIVTQIIIFVITTSFSTVVSIELVKWIFPNKTYSINTTLGPSGTISGPSYNLPDKFSVKYDSALRPAVVTHYYDALDRYEGFLIDFGNGKTGILNGKTTITGTQAGLKLSVKSSGGSISVT